MSRDSDSLGRGQCHGVRTDTWWGEGPSGSNGCTGIREGFLQQVGSRTVLKEKHEVTRQWEAADRGTEFQGGKHVSIRWSRPSLAHGDSRCWVLIGHDVISPMYSDFRTSQSHWM